LDLPDILSLDMKEDENIEFECKEHGAANNSQEE
jgi:hypothetical protein